MNECEMWMNFLCKMEKKRLVWVEKAKIRKLSYDMNEIRKFAKNEIKYSIRVDHLDPSFLSRILSVQRLMYDDNDIPNLWQGIFCKFIFIYINFFFGLEWICKISLAWRFGMQFDTIKELYKITQNDRHYRTDDLLVPHLLDVCCFLYNLRVCQSEMCGSDKCYWKWIFSCCHAQCF